MGSVSLLGGSGKWIIRLRGFLRSAHASQEYRNGVEPKHASAVRIAQKAGCCSRRKRRAQDRCGVRRLANLSECSIHAIVAVLTPPIWKPAHPIPFLQCSSCSGGTGKSRPPLGMTAIPQANSWG